MSQYFSLMSKPTNFRFSFSDIAHSVATAVEEQSLTTNEISQTISTLTELGRDDVAKVDVVAQEAEHIANAVVSLENSIARFK